MSSDIINSVLGTANFALGLGSLISSIKANKQARADQMYFYEDQKNWNSPANQMNLRRLAGLSPYSDFTAGSVGQPTPVNQAAGIPESLSLMQKGQENAFNAIATRIAYKQLNLQEKKVDNETKITDVRSRLLSSQNLYQEIMNFIAEETKGDRINITKAELQDLLNNVQYGTIRNEYASELYSKQIDNLIEDFLLKRENRKYISKDYNLRERSVINESLRTSADVSKTEEELKRMRWDNASLDALDQLIEDIDKDSKYSKTFKGLLRGALNIVKTFSSKK